MRTQTALLTCDVLVAPAQLTVIDDLAPGARHRKWSPITATLITERKSHDGRSALSRAMRATASRGFQSGSSGNATVVENGRRDM
jgi:hypothetical protein